MGDEELTDESLDQVRVLRHCGTWHVCIPRPPPAAPRFGLAQQVRMQIAKLMDYCAAEEDEWDAIRVLRQLCACAAALENRGGL